MESTQEMMDAWPGAQTELDSLQSDDFDAAVQAHYDGPVDDPFADAQNPDEQIAAMGFTEEELDLLREAGLYHPQVTEGPWAPQDLEDVDWVCWTALEMKREMEAIAARAKSRIGRLEKAHALFLDRYRDACQEIVTANLPRNKTGKITRKSLDLDRVKVKLTASAGGPAVTDEKALIAYIKQRAKETFYIDPFDDRPPTPEMVAFSQALRAAVTYEGDAALERLASDWEAKFSVLVTPIKTYVAKLPAVPDPSTGESLPATIPGVVINPPSETFSFE